MSQPNRYFHFSYYFKTETEEGFSSINVETVTFPSEEFLQMVAGAKIRKVYNLDKDTVVSVSIQNWSEFRNQKDYGLFIKRKS